MTCNFLFKFVFVQEILVLDSIVCLILGLINFKILFFDKLVDDIARRRDM